MFLAKFLHTESGKYLMSIILGFGLATLFRFTCKDRNCVILKAPDLHEITDKTFKYNGSCYKYEHVSQECDPSQKTIDM